nr:hypothetical protein [Tanacetum cinerariifolium]
MGYEHLSITPETKSDEVTKSNVENLLPIPSKCDVTLEDEIECNMPAKDVCSPVFTTFSNHLFKDNDDLDSSDDESLSDEDVSAEEFKIYSNPLFDKEEINSDKLDPHCFNVESDFIESLLNRDTFIYFSSKFDFYGELAHIKPEIPKSDFDFEEEIRLIENLLYDNSFPRPPKELNAKIEEIDIVTSSDDVLPPSDENDDDYDPLLEEVNLFLFDNSIPPGIENFADDPEGDIRFLEELLIDDSILSHESSDSNFEDNPSILRPPPEPPDDNFDLEPEVISAVMKDIDEPDEHFNPGGEIFVSTNNKYVDYFPFMFVSHIFLPYLILPEISPLLLFAESEDTIIDPGLFPEIEAFLCWNFCPDDLLNQMKNFMQNFQNGPPGEDKEHDATMDTELPSTEDIQPLPVQKPLQDSDIHQLIREECCVEVLEQQKQKIEDTMLEFVKICQEKEFLCIHDDVENLIESALDSKLLLINSNSQHLDKKEQEVKNIVEQPAERANHSIQSLQKFKVVYKKPGHSLSMGYEHLSITPETESDEVIESNTEKLLPIPSKFEVTLEDEIECDMLAKDVCSPVFTTFSNPLFKNNDNFDSSDDESLPDEDVPAEEFKIYSNPLCDEDKINSDKFDPHCFNEEIRLIENLVYDNSFPRPPEELNAEIADTIIVSIPLLPIPVQDGNSQQEEIDIVTKTDDVLPPSDENDDDSSDDSLLEEVDLFLSDNSIPSGIESFADDPEGDIRFLEGLLINDSILSYESSDSNFEDSPLIPRPPLESSDDNFDLEPEVISVVMEDIDEPDEHFNLGGAIFVSTNIKDVDYFPFMFVIRIFLPCLILLEISPLLLSAESEDTIFDPGLSPEVESFLCRIYVRFLRSSYPLIDFSLGRSISF